MSGVQDVINIELQGRLEPVAVLGDFKETMAELQLMAASGKSFVTMLKPNEKPISVRLDRILTIEPEDD